MVIERGTMASTSALPQPSRPATTTPTGLQPLPVPKPRNATSPAPDAPRATSPYQPSKLRSPSTPKPSLARSPLSNSNSTSNLNAARSASSGRGPGSPDKSLRRTISIASFPQPPKAGSRPPTATSGTGIPGANATASVKPKRSSRLSTGTTSSYRSSKTPSLLNGSADGKSVLAEADASPPHSRSSSAQGSCSTSATTFEEADDATTTGKASSKQKESKGNVLVSVRVRPDLSAGETPRNHGEWSVDGRQSLISYRGKEGGDYYYGRCYPAPQSFSSSWMSD